MASCGHGMPAITGRDACTQRSESARVRKDRERARRARPRNGCARRRSERGIRLRRSLRMPCRPRAAMPRAQARGIVVAVVRALVLALIASGRALSGRSRGARTRRNERAHVPSSRVRVVALRKSVFQMMLGLLFVLCGVVAVVPALLSSMPEPLVPGLLVGIDLPGFDGFSGATGAQGGLPFPRFRSRSRFPFHLRGRRGTALGIGGAATVAPTSSFKPCAESHSTTKPAIRDGQARSAGMRGPVRSREFSASSRAPCNGGNAHPRASRTIPWSIFA